MPSSPLRSERSDQENRPKKEILAHVVINYGHDSARIVREADPDGKPTEHLIVGTSRQIDTLLDKGILNNDQHLAGTTLRDLFEQSAFLSTLAARDPSAPLGMFSEPTPNEAALARYMIAMRQMGEWRRVLRAVVIEDRTPEDYERQYNCSGRLMLTIALDRLVRHFGLIARRS